ncbi:MAG TPA: DUF2887 domain-containing protein, partial [Planctomycetaceae bacterium]|nr:DUF2887 domain-containing protein [Planctomycetaceae bacterium]
MKTDRQVYKILEVCPEWFFDLTQIDSPGPCSFHSVALKEVSVTADGVIEPVAPEKPFYLIEFQAQSDDSVYVRLVLEMALVQRQHPGRGVEGVIIFLDEDLDPKTEPWHRVIRVFSLVSQLSELRERFPNHPLVSVFRPLTESRDKILEAEAADCYNQIVSSGLNQLTKGVLADVFV